MSAGRAVKKAEAERCLRVAGRLRAHLAALQSLGLNGAESGLVAEALSHVEAAKANLSGIMAGLEIDPEAAQESGARQARAPGGIKL